MKQILKYLIFIMIGIIIYSYINSYNTFSIGIPPQRDDFKESSITQEPFRLARPMSETPPLPPPTAEEGIPPCEPEPEPEPESETELLDVPRNLLLIRNGGRFYQGRGGGGGGGRGGGGGGGGASGHCRHEIYPTYVSMDAPGLDTIRLVPQNVNRFTLREVIELPLRESYRNIDEFFVRLTHQDYRIIFIPDNGTFDPNTLGRLYRYGNAIYERLYSILVRLNGITLEIINQIFAFLVPNVTRYRPSMEQTLQEEIPEEYPTRDINIHTNEDIDLRIDRILRILYYLNGGFNRLVIVDRINVVDRQVNIGYMVFLHNPTIGQVVHLFHIHPIMMINPENGIAEIQGGVMIQNDQDQRVRQYVFADLLLPHNLEIERRIRQAMTVNYMGVTNVHLGAPVGLGQIIGRAAQRGAGPGLLCAARHYFGV